MLATRLDWLLWMAVVAFVMAGCLSPTSTASAAYSWQEAQAQVTPEGDLLWRPEPFVFRGGDSARYIDYEAGDDASPGTKDAPWKHHPWDAQASGNAAACAGIHTYVFRRGATYRGVLVAKESGAAGDPIRLTSDPSWGEGEAVICGSVQLTGGWTRADAQSAPGIPEPEKVWYRDIGTDFAPRCLWEVRDGRITRIPIARTPNWTVTNPDDVKSEWYEWENVEKANATVDGQSVTKAFGIDAAHLTAPEPDAYVGAAVWTEYSGVMGTPYAVPVEAYDPARHAIRFGGPWGPAAEQYAPILHCRYFLENLPRFLDSPGEYYYAATGPQAGRIYVRLPEDRDPNTARVEAARQLTLVDIVNQSHIHVSGLTFRFQNVAQWYDRWWTMADVDPACVKARGACVDIRVSNCRFEHVAMAVWVVAEGEGRTDDVAVTDSEILHTDFGAIQISRGRSDLNRVEVLRNRLYEIGLRPMRAQHGHALVVEFAALPEIAGNVLDRCYGAGLFIFGGKSGGRGAAPLSRVLMHHNKVTDSLLNTNDWGGIEFWQGGPAYIYDNISGNPGGYWHWSHLMRGKTAEERNHVTARFGFAYYLDGGFKCYVFNNVAWGKSSDLTSPLCATAAFHEVIGFLNSFVNNTAYRFAAPFRRQVPEGGRGYYLGNLVMDASEVFFRHADIEGPEDVHLAQQGRQPYPVDTLAYADNVFLGKPRRFGYFDRDAVYKTLEEFRAGLEARHALASETGWHAEQAQVRDAEHHDFRPTPGSAVRGRGVKYFVPWGLYAEVGQWHFYRHPADLSRILDEHWFMSEEYAGREMYRAVPRNDLVAHGVTEADFVRGTLEDWTEGALRFNGREQYCSLADATMKSDFTYRNRTVPGSQRATLDMGANNFLVEAYLRTEAGSTGGVIAAKAAEAGYVLDVDDAGRARLTLRTGGQPACSRSSAAAVNDGQWHHVLAEVDRSAGQGISIYVDGKRADGEWSGTMPAPDASLANTADFLVGRGPDGGWLAGTLDFLRLARGTLADAQTSIEELHEWEFNGPFLKDLTGKAPAAGRRDAGAIHGGGAD
jgi:hypothetical protein